MKQTKMRNGGMRIELDKKTIDFIKAGYEITFDVGDDGYLQIFYWTEDCDSIDEAIKGGRFNRK